MTADELRSALKERRFSPADALKQHPELAVVVAEQRKLPPEVGVQLAKSSDVRVREELAHNSTAPRDALKLLKDDRVLRVAEQAGRRLAQYLGDRDAAQAAADCISGSAFEHLLTGWLEPTTDELEPVFGVPDRDRAQRLFDEYVALATATLRHHGRFETLASWRAGERLIFLALGEPLEVPGEWFCHLGTAG